MIEIDNKYYIFDLERICDFVSISNKMETKEKEILDDYKDGILSGKTIRELTTQGNAQIDNIRYDLIKTFILEIITYDNVVTNLYDMPFGLQISWNTLLHNGILKEIN